MAEWWNVGIELILTEKCSPKYKFRLSDISFLIERSLWLESDKERIDRIF